MKIIDIRSDTVTQPTEAMRRAMAAAEVGDDGYGDDPTIRRLEELAARLMGKEAALFVPSGVMGNQLSIMTHTKRGDDVLCGRNSHIFVHEVGAASVLSGVTLNVIASADDILYPQMVRETIREDDIGFPPSTLLCLENALSNGGVVPLEVVEESCRVARERGLRIHLDGARIFNAAIALGKPAATLAAPADSVMFCLSKGLCAPVGSIVAGEKSFIDRATKNRKLMGGGMRQAGVLAAAGIVALEEMTGRLQEDHAHARLLESLLEEIPGVQIHRQPLGINMAYFALDRPREVIAALPALLLGEGIKINGESGGVFRFVTNNDVSKEDVYKVAETVKQLLC